jgi:hypothetical protein
MSEVVTAFGEGEVWTYEPLTSQPGVQPLTFGSSVSIPGMRTVNRQVTQEYDERSHSFKRMEVLTLVSPGYTLIASQGDRVSDGTLHWAIDSLVVGYALTHWTVKRDLSQIQSRKAQAGL